MNTKGSHPKSLEKDTKNIQKHLHQHLNIKAPLATVDNFSIIGREGHNLATAINEAIYIRVNNPTLNKNVGKYNLQHIWD